jgi:hypothetical protein
VLAGTINAPWSRVGFHDPLMIGAWWNGPHAPHHLRDLFEGPIDDVRIYNHALSAKEVSAIYDSEKPRG